jgi:tetratricopeptide (TPR) repeat protein
MLRAVRLAALLALTASGARATPFEDLFVQAKAEEDTGAQVELWGKAVEAWKEGDDKEALSMAEGKIGIGLVKLGKPKEALPWLEKALIAQPDFIKCHIARGHAYHLQHRYAQAVDVYRYVLSRKTEMRSAHGALCEAYGKLGELENAMMSCEKRFALGKPSPQAYLARGHVYADQGEYEKALADFEHVRKTLPEDAPIATYQDTSAKWESLPLLGVGYVHYKKGDYVRAWSYYESAVKKSPGNPEGYWRRGQLRAAKKESEGALADFDKALELDPEFVDAFVDRGSLRASLGARDKALDDFRQACDRGFRRGCTLLYK